MVKTVAIHIILWIIYASYGIFDSYYRNNMPFIFLAYIMTYLLLAAVFYYTALFVFPRFFHPRKYIFLFLFVVFGWGAYVLIDYAIEGYFEVYYYHYEPLPFTIKGFVIPITWFYVQHLIYGIGYYFIRRSFQKERDLRRKEVALQEQAKEKLLLENELLRAQINPHFVFNTLNHLYDEARQKAPPLADTIQMLSHVMRYTVTQLDADGRVPLESEVTYINNILSLNRKRFGTQFYVHFETSGTMNGRILPHIFITLVENALKHGITRNPDYPVQISLHIENQQACFSTTNRKREGAELPGEKIGLQNLVKRLQLHYPGQYKFAINDDGAFYSTQLTIPL